MGTAAKVVLDVGPGGQSTSMFWRLLWMPALCAASRSVDLDAAALAVDASALRGELFVERPAWRRRRNRVVRAQRHDRVLAALFQGEPEHHVVAVGAAPGVAGARGDQLVALEVHPERTVMIAVDRRAQDVADVRGAARGRSAVLDLEGELEWAGVVALAE